MNTTDAERILKLFADSLEQGKSFTLDQAPEVVQQLILWKRVEYGVTVVVLLLFAFIGWRLAITCSRLANEAKKEKYERSDWRGGQIMAAVSTFFLCGFAITIGVQSLQVWLAPKIYVLEYATNLLR